MNIGYTINYCSKLLRNKLNTALEKEDLTIAQFAVIKDIEMNSSHDENKTSVIAVDIAERLDMDKPTVSGIVNRLVEKNYVEKLANPEDKRSFILKLTNKSSSKIARLEEINQIVLSEAISGLTEEEQEAFKKTLSKIIDNLR